MVQLVAADLADEGEVGAPAVQLALALDRELGVLDGGDDEGGTRHSGDSAHTSAMNFEFWLLKMSLRFCFSSPLGSSSNLGNSFLIVVV